MTKAQIAQQLHDELWNGVVRLTPDEGMRCIVRALDDMEKARLPKRHYWGCGCGWINDVMNVNCGQCTRTVLDGGGAIVDD